MIIANQVNDGYFRCCQKPNGRSPCAGSLADVHGFILADGVIPGVFREKKTGHEYKRENLSSVRVTGELQIKIFILSDGRLML